jgi:GNAT superfamily N-acetyltransferase
MDIRPLTPELRADAAGLFESSAPTRGCWCIWFLLPVKDVQGGWGAANRERFAELAEQDPAAGLLAYAGGQAVGWCATGPRSRYPTAARSRLMKDRDPAEDDRVWFVPCFFVRPGSRRGGITQQLLLAAVDYAGAHGATAVEGFPLAGDGPHKNDRYLGTEPLFTACGFSAIARPSPRRVVMRRETA